MDRSAGIALSLLAGALVCLIPDRGVSQGPAGSSVGLAAYDRIASVLQGPRCLNCHPRGDRPTQGDDRHTHLVNVQRGPDSNGMPAMRCSACHQAHNNDVVGIPGAPHWHLAPASMGWVGLSKGELCRTLLDRRKNGGRDVPRLIAHITGDELVAWAWQPGAGRSAPALTMDDLKIALDAWAAAGAPCPK
jgi:hypothetical protein